MGGLREVDTSSQLAGRPHLVVTKTSFLILDTTVLSQGSLARDLGSINVESG